MGYGDPNSTVNITGKPENEALAEMLAKFMEPRILEPTRGDGNTAAVLVVPKGFDVHPLKKLLDEYLPAPERRTGSFALGTLESFVAFVNRYKDGDSVVYADPSPTKPRLVAVFDAHRAGPDGGARFGEFKANYAFPVDDFWKAWMGVNGRSLSQAEFASFIEEHITDIITAESAGEKSRAYAETIGATFASPQKMLELSNGLSAQVDARVTDGVKLASGERTLVFTEQHNDENGAPLKIPGAFLVQVPVFRAGNPYVLRARLRYRIASGKVTWTILLHQPEVTFQHAFDEAVGEAGEKTALPVFVGAPST